MAQPFDTVAASVPTLGLRHLVLIDGRTFAISDEAGQIHSPTHGLVHGDLRHLSVFECWVESTPTELLACSSPTPLSAVIVARLAPAAEAASIVLTRRRWVAGGMREEVQFRNNSTDDLALTVNLRVRADFAHIFDVKAGRTTAPGEMHHHGGVVAITASVHGANARTSIVCSPRPDTVDTTSGILRWELTVPARDDASICIAVEPIVDDVAGGLAFPCGVNPASAIPLRQLERWKAGVPTVVSTDPRIATVVDQALADIAALRIVDRDHPDRVVIAAGAPWFMTLFGRDSLLASWMTLPFDAQLAVGVLESLASLQGTRFDPMAEEQPGKILHELRRHGGGGPFASRERYYGTVDATPLFVMLAAEAHRWGALSSDNLRSLRPAVDAALSWILGAGDANGDGFVDYRRSDPSGLSNQGWKDSWDGITFRDGTLPEGPIALVEVQGYVYAALLGAAELAEPMNLQLSSDELRSRAEVLKRRFNEAFWDPQGWFAVGLDGSGRRIDSLTTNPGHALWTGIAEPALASLYLDRLLAPDMWTGWGLRTLSEQMAAYDPLSYHNGSVWPHDTALCAAGAARYGRWDVVDRIVDGAFDAAVHFDGRPPELFAGISRQDAPMPVAYPASCSPQAWSSASALLLVRCMLDLTPTHAGLSVNRASNSVLPDMRLSGIRFRGASVAVATSENVATVDAIDE